jgi:hypothetical protein
MQTPMHLFTEKWAAQSQTELMVEACLAVARGERKLALIAGVEAIANQKFGQRNNVSADWSEELDTPLITAGKPDSVFAPIRVSKRSERLPKTQGF